MDCAETEFCVFLDASNEIIIERIRSRTGGRNDDDPSIVALRLDTYTNETRPIFELFTKEGKLRRIDASGTKEEVYSLFRDVVS